MSKFYQQALPFLNKRFSLILLQSFLTSWILLEITQWLFFSFTVFHMSQWTMRFATCLTLSTLLFSRKALITSNHVLLLDMSVGRLSREPAAIYIGLCLLSSVLVFSVSLPYSSLYKSLLIYTEGSYSPPSIRESFYFIFLFSNAVGILFPIKALVMKEFALCFSKRMSRISFIRKHFIPSLLKECFWNSVYIVILYDTLFYFCKGAMYTLLSRILGIFYG